jgi:S1-C subfamily serine protease
MTMRRYSSSMLCGFFLALPAAAQDIPNVSPNQVAPNLSPDRSISQDGVGSTVYSRAVNGVVWIECAGNDKKGEAFAKFGTGSILTAHGVILTNHHVVDGADRCHAALKPQGLAALTSKTPRYKLAWLALEPSKDLALLVMENAPAGLVSIPLGSMEDVQVGQEVHAIGHPRGQAWTYTKGVVSQIHIQAQGNPPFVADIVQTQTPISTGNSGGPLLTSSGKLIAVNTFARNDAQNLNYAVAVSEVHRFIGDVMRRPDSKPRPFSQAETGTKAEAESAPSTAKPADCESPKTLGEERSRKSAAKIVSVDIGCTGRANAAYFVPDDPDKEMVLHVSTQSPAPGGDRYFDVRYYVDQRTGKVLWSWHDVDRDGKPDYMGVHKNGEKTPSEFIPFNATLGRRVFQP